MREEAKIQTFRTKIKASKPHYVNKVISCKKTLTDALRPNCKTHFSVFIPKMTKENLVPVVMFHIGNGGGGCLLRCDHPTTLADKLEELVGILRSDIWLDIFEEMEHVHGNLMDTEKLPLVDTLMDLKGWI